MSPTRAAAPRSAVPEGGGIDDGGPPSGRVVFDGIDGLRAIAAFAVVAHHVGFDTGATFRSGAGAYLARLDIGVSIFFALSGFLLFRPMVAALVERRPALGLAEFWKRRVLRVFPAYWVALAAIVLVFGEQMRSIGDVVVYGGLLQIYDEDRALGAMVQAWSLCTEISFYLVLPLLGLALRRALATRAPRVQLRALLATCAALYGLGVAWRAYLFAADPWFDRIGLLWLPGQIDHFAIGMAVAVVSVWAGHDGAVARRVAPLASRATLWWVGALVAFWVVSTRLSLTRSLDPIPAADDLARQFLYGLVALLLLVPVALAPSTTSPVVRWLAHPVMAWLGVLSYGVYLWHKDLVPKVQHLFGWENFEGSFIVVFGVVAAASVAIAAVSYFLVEQPLLARKHAPARRPMTVWRALSTPRAASADDGRARDGRGIDAPTVDGATDDGPTVEDPAVARARTRRWRTGLALITLAGLAVRLGYLWFSRRGIYECPPEDLLGCAGDSYVYHTGANLVAAGRGFVSPLGLLSGNEFPAADHPPLYTVYLALFSKLGADTYLWHQLATMAVGVASVPLAGLIGRNLGRSLGRPERLGWLAAALCALYPYIWVNDGLVLSETTVVFTVLLAAVVAYRTWRAPTMLNAALLGVACALAAYSRAEAALLVPLVAFPMLIRTVRLPLKRGIALAGVAGVSSLLVVSPWLVRNQLVFDETVGLSTGLGVTMRYSNCDQTYYGTLLGFWWYECKGEVDLQVDRDQSVLDKELREEAIEYIGDHTSRLPAVLAARVGRTWNLYKPNQVTYLDELERRPLWASRLGLISFYPVMALAGLGAVTMWRRRVPIAPLLVPLGTVTFAVLLTFGQTRYRATSEGVTVVLAAVGLARVIDAVAERRR
jgi:peptidoglycan/LPS O-acetylase OafA/YrhL